MLAKVFRLVQKTTVVPRLLLGCNAYIKRYHP